MIMLSFYAYTSRKKPKVEVGHRRPLEKLH